LEANILLNHPLKSQGWSATSSLVVRPPEQNPSDHLVVAHHMTGKGQASVADDSGNPWQAIVELCVGGLTLPVNIQGGTKEPGIVPVKFLAKGFG